MNILCVADGSMENPASGLEQVLFQQARGLAQRGAKVFCITRADGKFGTRIRTIHGVTEGCIGSGPGTFPSQVGRLIISARSLFRRFSPDHGFDILIVHQPLVYASLLLSGCRPMAPFIYVYHSPWHEEYRIKTPLPHSSMVHIAATTRRRIEAICLRRAARTVVLSRYMQQIAITRQGVAPDRTVVNPGGADTGRFQPPRDRNALKRRNGLPEGAIHLLTIRNLEPRMGIDLLIDAVAHLKRRNLFVFLQVGGAGPEAASLKQLVHQLGLEDRVNFLGFIPHERMAEVYGAADFFILPTRQLEGFGLITPEAMACGTPVLGTPVGGTAEILGRFEPSFLFREASSVAIADGIGQTLQRYPDVKGARYLELRERCRRFAVEGYSWQRHVTQLMKVIDETLHP